jgi:hypothetical protein
MRRNFTIWPLRGWCFCERKAFNGLAFSKFAHDQLLTHLLEPLRHIDESCIIPPTTTQISQLRDDNDVRITSSNEVDIDPRPPLQSCLPLDIVLFLSPTVSLTSRTINSRIISLLRLYSIWQMKLQLSAAFAAFCFPTSILGATYRHLNEASSDDCPDIEEEAPDPFTLNNNAQSNYLVRSKS